MKVLFLANIPSPYRVDFFQELGKLCNLTVLYELKKAGDRNTAWKRELAEKSYKEIFMKPIFRQVSSAWCPSVIKYLRDKSYDIIVVGVYSTLTGMSAVRYLKRHKIPYFLNCDGGIISFEENSFRRKLKTYLISGAAGYLSTGKAGDNYLVYYGAEKEKIYRYPFTSVFEKDIRARTLTKKEKETFKLQLGIAEEKMVITVGNFIPRKGFDILLRAAGRMRNDGRAESSDGSPGSVGIYLVGGEETSEYRKIREDLKLQNIHFIPFLTKEELQKYYLAADLFVLPTREDIWGLVINEAMAAGLPIITTERCVAGVEMLDKECIVPVEDEKILAEKMEWLLKNGELMQCMSENNLSKIREYTFENMARVHFGIFQTFLRK